LKHNLKLLVTIRLKSGLRIVDVNIEKPVNILEMLQIVSDIIDYDLVSELIVNDSILPGVFIQVDGEDIHHLNILDAQITKSTTVSIFSAEMDA